MSLKETRKKQCVQTTRKMLVKLVPTVEKIVKDREFVPQGIELDLLIKGTQTIASFVKKNILTFNEVREITDTIRPGFGLGVVAMIAPTLGLQARFDPYAGDFGRLELIKIHQ